MKHMYPQEPARGGATLSEVLISLLVMSIGVVSLATLFPVSVLRSIQATQLTNAANLRYNVEALTAVRPELLNGATPWAPLTAYTTIPPATNARSIVVPNEQLRQEYPRIMFYCSTAGTSGTTEPTNWNFKPGATTTDGTVTWTAFKADVYIVDPLGYHLVDENNVVGYRDYFGNDGSAAVTRVPRLTPTWAATSQSAAADAATLPDSWVDQVESIDVVNVTATSYRLNDVTVDLSQSAPAAALPRAVFFDATGKTSVIRSLTGITAGSQPVISWAASSGALPFTPAKCRVETAERRYTWLLSVRRGASGASFMDVVVFFRRSYDPREEIIYPAFFTEVFDPGFDGAAGFVGVDDDRDGNTDTQAGVPDPEELGFPGSDDLPRNWVVVQYKSSGYKPHYKKGGYICDIQNLRWYRILETREAPDSAPFASPFAAMPTGNDDLWKPTVNVPSTSYSAGGYDRAVWIKVENKILEDSLPASNSNTPDPLYGGAMFVKGVVDVFPIRTRLPWE